MKILSNKMWQQHINYVKCLENENAYVNQIAIDLLDRIEQLELDVARLEYVNSILESDSDNLENAVKSWREKVNELLSEIKLLKTNSNK